MDLVLLQEVLDPLWHISACFAKVRLAYILDQCYDEMVELAVGSVGYDDHGLEELPLLGFVAEMAGDLEEP